MSIEAWMGLTVMVVYTIAVFVAGIAVGAWLW